MASATYRLFREAILRQRQVTCLYQHYRRELCPHILGHTDGNEKVLAFQFAGGSRSGLPAGGEWRCLYLAQVREAQTRAGAWHAGRRHRKQQTCVDVVDLDTNIPVRRARNP